MGRPLYTYMYVIAPFVIPACVHLCPYESKEKLTQRMVGTKNCLFVVLAGFFGYTPFGTLTITNQYREERKEICYVSIADRTHSLRLRLPVAHQAVASHPSGDGPRTGDRVSG